MKNNKYLYLWIVQARTSQKGRGWQAVRQSKNYGKARASLKACQDASKAKHRLIKRRIPNPNYSPSYQDYKEALKP